MRVAVMVALSKAERKRRHDLDSAAGSNVAATAHRTVLLSIVVCMFGPPVSAAVLSSQELDQDSKVVRVTAHLRDADTKAPLMGALIELEGPSIRYVTGTNGQVSFAIPAGRYAVTVYKAGYATLRAAFRIAHGGDLTMMMHQLGDIDTNIPERLLVRITEFGSGRLIEGATVSLAGGETRTTDGDGWVEFRAPRGPVAEVTVRMLGYETRTESVSLHEGQTTLVEVAMAIDAVVVAPIEVNARSRFLRKHGVYWRIDRGWPEKLLSRAELMERAKPRLSDAFRQIIPRVYVENLGHLTVLRSPSGCRVAVYMDGQPLGLDVGGLSIDDIPPEDLELAEIYYADRTPGRFPGACGAILLWSQRRAGGRSRWMGQREPFRRGSPLCAGSLFRPPHRRGDVRRGFPGAVPQARHRGGPSTPLLRFSSSMPYCHAAWGSDVGMRDIRRFEVSA